MKRFTNHEALRTDDLHALVIATEALARNMSDLVSSMIDQEIRAALARAAIIADHVGAKARPGEAKETADEIGWRIRAMMEEGR
jgi:hypothetical protein